MFLRAGLRYAGPAIGPAWEPRTPRCEGCGYIIANIPVSTNCPECGRPVEASLPERRKPPAFVEASTFAQATKAFDKTLRAAISDKNFFKHLAVNRDVSRDRVFFLTGAALTIVLPTSIAICLLRNAAAEIQVDSIAAVLMAAGIVFASIVILIGLIATLAALVGRRSLGSAAIPTFYGATGLFTLLFGVALLLPTFPLAAWLMDATRPTAGVMLGFLGLACLLTPGAWLTFIGLRNIVRACRYAFPHTRRANS